MSESDNERWSRVMGQLPQTNLPGLTPAPQHAVSTANSMGIRATLMREDRPKFTREYTAAITERVRIKVRYRSLYGPDRYGTGELTQHDGRWVLFDPKRIADKILDPVLVPLVEAACEAILKMDREFIASKPSEFTDEGGTVWARR